MADLPVRADLRGTRAYEAPQLDVAVRLNTNENSHPLPGALIEDIAAAARMVATGLNRYPDRAVTALREDLATYLSRYGDGAGLGVENLWAANGSNEILQQILQAFAGAGRTALGFTPSYQMHPVIARSTGTAWVDGGREDDFSVSAQRAVGQVREHRPDLVFLCAPNNPTGTPLPLDVVRAVLDEAPGMVVVDEAYAEFGPPQQPTALSLLPTSPRLVVTRTMSKAFGMAGLRLGYLAAGPEVVRALQLVRLPYHLSALSQVVARTALAHAPALLATVEEIKEQRDRIAAELPSLGLTSVASEANFLLVGRFGDERAAWQELLDHGVLVRDVGLAGWLRVTAGTKSEVDAFLAALAATRRGDST